MKERAFHFIYYRQYDWQEEENRNNVNYFPNLTEDKRSIMLTWGETNELEAYLNQNIRMMIEEKISGIENRIVDGVVKVSYWTVKATKDMFMMDYKIYYEGSWGMGELERTERYSMEINLATGLCRLVGSEERMRMNQQEYRKW